jgi:hypothetical protein
MAVSSSSLLVASNRCLQGDPGLLESIHPIGITRGGLARQHGT